MKRQHLPFLLLAASALSLSGCGNSSSIEKHIDIDYINPNIVLGNDFFAPHTFNLNVLVGKKADIVVDAIPDSFAKEAKFKSLDESIATVDETGKVSGVKKGHTQIEVSAKDGSRKELVNVYVNEATKTNTSLSILNKIYENSQDPSYKADTVLWTHEIVQQDMLREGKVYNSAKYIEELAYVATDNDAYFMVTSEDIAIKTEDGAPEVSNGTWRFFVEKESHVTYLLHETSSAKRFMQINTQSYSGRPLIDPILDVLDMFFVDGRTIVTDMMDDASGVDQMGPKGFITDCLTNPYDNVKLSCGSETGVDDLHVDLALTNEDSEENPQIISAEEEFNIEIPAGTHYDQVAEEEYFFNHDRVTGWNYAVDLSYELDGKKCDRVFKKSTRYDRSYECVYPDLKAYSEVDSIYDL